MTHRFDHLIRATTLACLISLVSLLFVTSQPAAAQQGRNGWSPPVTVSEPTEPSWFADVYADPYGYSHIAWSTSDDAYDMIGYTVSMQEGPWREKNIAVAIAQTPPGHAYVARPNMTSDDSGYLYMGYQHQDVFVGSSPVESAWNPWEWYLPDAIGGGYFSIPVYDGKGGLHLLTTEGSTNIICGCYQLTYRHASLEDLDWSEPTDLSRSTLMGAAKPQVWSEPAANRLLVVWEQGYDGNRGYVGDPAKVMFSATNDGGATWTPPLQIAPEAQADPSAQSRNITIGRDKQGDLIAVWWEMPDNLVMYRQSPDDGVTWSLASPLPRGWGVGGLSTTRQDDYTLAADSNGDLHLVYVGLPDADASEIHVLHTVWDGNAWSTPESLAGYLVDLPEWPRITIGLGNIVDVVWHLRPEYRTRTEGNQPMQIVHTRRILSSPAIDPKPLPPRAHAAGIGPTPTMDPSIAFHDMLPVGELTDEQRKPSGSGLQRQNIESENDDVLLLFLAILPVSALVLGMTLLLRRNQK